MSYIIHNPYQYDTKPVFGDGENAGECAQLAQQAYALQNKRDMPQTRRWRAGDRVCDFKPGQLMPGTVLATFDDKGRYHNRHGYHTVIFASLHLDKKGRPYALKVIHQYKAIGSRIRRATFLFGPNVEHFKDARNYRVVEPL